MLFIDENYINSLMVDENLLDPRYQRDIISKASEAKGLSLKEAAALLNISSPELYDELFYTAKEVKEQIYGNRLVIFAPLYTSNLCVNNCLYCAFRRDNRKLVRKALTLDQIENEAETLIKQGQKRILMVCGEHPKKSDTTFIGEAMTRIYNLNINGGNIRRINVNTAPLSIEKFRELKSYGLGTYQCFQETYHYDTYMRMHPDGPKRDYSWRLYAMDRAYEAGIEDVGIGALFGLTDYRFETLALLSHAFDLDSKYGVGPHTISIPRLEPALDAPAAISPPHAVDDLSFKKLVAVIRLAVPYTGIILSTRERAELRREVFNVGVSQISAGSRTAPGSYNDDNNPQQERELEQFQLGDHRSLDEIVKDITEHGFLPSFCTACYRTNRTGDRFMELAKTGAIGKICVPNALSTFKEYLNDYASEETKKAGQTLLNNELIFLEPKVKRKVDKMLDQVDKGERDVFF